MLNLASLTDPTKNRWLQRILVSATLSLDVDRLHTWNLRCPQLFKAEEKRENKDEAMQIDGKSGPEQTIILPNLLTHNLVKFLKVIIIMYYKFFPDSMQAKFKTILFISTNSTEL
jgi:hypothetical protein